MSSTTLAEATVPAELEAGPAVGPEDESARNFVDLGAALAMTASLMVFAGLLAGVLALRSGAGVWPPEGVSLDNYLATVLLATALMASASAQWSVQAARRDDQRDTVIGLAMAVGLGLALVNGVWYAIGQAGFGPGDHAYGVVFFALLGTYLVHVLGAVVITAVGVLRAMGGQFTAREHRAPAAIAAGWHLLTVVWVAVFYVVWVLE